MSQEKVETMRSMYEAFNHLDETLVVGTVDRSDVIAYLDAREEQEIVALPECGRRGHRTA